MFAAETERKGTEGRPLCRPVFFTLHFLFPIGNNPTLATPQSALRLTAPLKGAPLRGKDFKFCAVLGSAPPLSRFPYRRIKTAPMLLSMGAVLPGIQGAFFLGAEVCVLR